MMAILRRLAGIAFLTPLLTACGQSVNTPAKPEVPSAQDAGDKALEGADSFAGWASTQQGGRVLACVVIAVVIVWIKNKLGLPWWAVIAFGVLLIPATLLWGR